MPQRHAIQASHPPSPCPSPPRRQASAGVGLQRFPQSHGRRGAALGLAELVLWGLALTGLAPGPLVQTAWGRDAELELRVTEKQSGELVAVRMHLKDQRGRPVIPPGVPAAGKDHFVFPGTIVLQLRPGDYTFEMERGPEYRVRYGYFTVKKDDADTTEVEMDRYLEMSRFGWWSGDLFVDKPAKELPLWMLAEDLHVLPAIAWEAGQPLDSEPQWTPQKLPQAHFLSRFAAGRDRRGGGELLFLNLGKPFPAAPALAPEHPSGADFLKAARQQSGSHVHVAHPFAWDYPMYLASGLVHSVGLANNHLGRDRTLPQVAGGRPRDRVLFPGAWGTGRWSEAIYYRTLNAGLRLPPAAGSGGSSLVNPPGYNRVYAHVDGELTWDKWWASLRAGQVVVTNGPLMRPLVNGQLPGHVFRAANGPVELEIQLQFAIRDPVEYLEIVKNGQVVEQVRLDKYAEMEGHLPKIRFERSGWLLVRAITENQKTYRFGTTGPYYVEIGGVPRISRAAAQFFLDWVHQRARQIRLTGPQREEVIRYHRAARDFWQTQVEQANAD